MGNVNCCKKPEEVLVLEGKETINTLNTLNESFQDKDEYPHDSDPAFRNRNKEEENPQIEEIDETRKDGN